MTTQASLEKIFLLAAWIEVIFYGFLFCMYGAMLYLHFSPEYSRIGGKRERHTRVMIVISSIMFAAATLHLSINAYRFVRSFSDNLLSPGGPAAYLGRLRKWDQVFNYTLFVTQVNLGSAAAIYRCWILWNYNWKIGFLPTILLLTSTAVGYLVCGTYSSIDPSANIFVPHLSKRISTFYSIVVGLNAISSSLIAYRIWKAHTSSANYRLDKSIPFSRIFVESAVLQLAFQIVLLVLYAADINAQYIMLESITPVIGIVFNAITIRMKLRSGSSSITTTSEVVGVTTMPTTHMAHICTIGGTDLGPNGKRVRVFSVIEEIDEEGLQSFKNESNPEIGHAL